jgi:hydroxyacylglutathione hydrolase
MSPKEYHLLRSKNEVFLFIDIRERYEYDYENLGAKHIPLGDFLNRLDEIPKDKTVVIHCQSGARAGKLTDVLHSMGYENVHNLEGGIEAYVNFSLTHSHD